MTHHPDRTIVVGVDGSERSLPVLRWAAEQAGATGAVVKAVMAWHYPELPGHHPARTESALSATVEGIVDRLVDEACPGATVETVIREDAPAHLLLREAKDADLIVLGTRGADHTASLGSVTRTVLLQAHCPVVVVPVPARG